MTDDFRDGFDCAVVLCGDVFAVVLAGVTRARCDAGAFDDAWLLATCEEAVRKFSVRMAAGMMRRSPSLGVLDAN